jgi:hypothetical protein
MGWLVRKAWFPALTTVLFWGGDRIDWPGPMVAVGIVVAAVLVAAAAFYLVHSTHNIDPGYRWIEIVFLVVGWLMSLAIVVFAAARDPLAGVAGGALLIFVASVAFPRHTARIVGFIRPEDKLPPHVPAHRRRAS